MEQFLFSALLGIGAGGLYAMLGTGIVIGYRGSGVINFGHGAIAMYTAFTFSDLRTAGDLRLPWPNLLLPLKWLQGTPGLGWVDKVRIPTNINLGDTMAFFPAFVISILMSVFLGLGMHFLVFRPLRHAAVLGKVIGSVGVMLYLMGIATLNFGTLPRGGVKILPSTPWRNFLGLGGRMPADKVWLAVLSIVFGAVLWAFYRYTRFGLATRAGASNEKGVTLLGYSPQFLAAANWVIASVLAGVAGILFVPTVNALNVLLTLTVTVALSAALVGNFTSIPVTVAAGLSLGILKDGIPPKLVKYDWWPDGLTEGVDGLILLAVVIGVLSFRGDVIPERGRVREAALARSPKPEHLVISSAMPAVLVVIATVIFTAQWDLAISTTLITATLMLSYVVITGYVGQISLAQLALAGTAAYASARFAANGTNDFTKLPGEAVTGLDWPFPLTMIAGVAIAVVVGVVIGIPALRIRGVQLAIVTLVAAGALQDFFFENKTLAGERAGAATPIRPAEFLGIDLQVRGSNGQPDRWQFTMFALVVLIGVALSVANIRRGKTGRRFLAIRANERAAAAAGIDVARTKLLAFGIGSGIAGIGGVMMSYKFTNIDIPNFDVMLAISLLAFVYLGGITRVSGAIVGGMLAAGGVVVVVASLHVKGIEEYTQIIGGAALVFTSVRNPEGIAGTFQEVGHTIGTAIRGSTKTTPTEEVMV